MIKWEVNQKPMRDFEVYLNELEKQNKDVEIAFCDITNSWVRYVIKIKDESDGKVVVKDETKTKTASTKTVKRTSKRTAKKDSK